MSFLIYSIHLYLQKAKFKCSDVLSHRHKWYQYSNYYYVNIFMIALTVVMYTSVTVYFISRQSKGMFCLRCFFCVRCTSWTNTNDAAVSDWPKHQQSFHKWDKESNLDTPNYKLFCSAYICRSTKCSWTQLHELGGCDKYDLCIRLWHDAVAFSVNGFNLYSLHFKFLHKSILKIIVLLCLEIIVSVE